MDVTRREFLKATGGTTGAAAAMGGMFGLSPVKDFAAKTRLRLKHAKQTTTICPYCGCGCGMIVSASQGKVINIEGDPDHPINEGSLCSKGSALYQVANNKRRQEKILYRAPRSARWEEKTWGWAIDRISERIWATRNADLNAPGKSGKDTTRVDSIAALGGAALDNEECYLYSKFMRALGVVNIEHQARI